MSPRIGFTISLEVYLVSLLLSKAERTYNSRWLVTTVYRHTGRERGGEGDRCNQWGMAVRASVASESAVGY
jgi:hypothetical protein